MRHLYLAADATSELGVDNRTARRRLGPDVCFKQDHLYTLFFKEAASDVIEKVFFGRIDNRGAAAVGFFANYQVNDGSHAAVRNFIPYMDAQKWRTPKGLDYLKKLAGPDHGRALMIMRHVHQVHATIWLEGVWEVLSCDDSATKFIVSDHPVTTYNRALFPQSQECLYPLDAPIDLLGTHTLFPLSMSRCLVITNLGYVRNPEASPLKVRQNPRTFAQTMWDIRRVQTGRQISEAEVRAINYILKTRARRYIAAADQDWLFPERHMKSTMWNKLGGPFFLMPDPRKVPFTTDFLVGYADGSAWGQDEYGRRSTRSDRAVEELRRREFAAHQKHKARWTNEFGELSDEEFRKAV